MESREAIDIDLQRYLQALIRRWVPAASIFALTVTLAAFATTLLKPSYEAAGKLLFKVDRTASLTGLATEGEGELRPLVNAQNPLSTEIEILTSRPLLQKTIDALGLKDENGQLLKSETVKQKLTVKIVGGTDVVAISYESRDPEEAAAVVNKLMSLYVINNISTQRQETATAREFITKQLRPTETKVREAEAALRQFKEQNNVVALGEEATSAVQMMANLDSQITSVQAQLEQANARVESLREKVKLTPQQSIGVSALSQSPAVQGVLEQLQEVERQLAIGRSRYGENHPSIRRLVGQQASLQAVLQQQRQTVVGSQTPVSNGLLQLGELRQQLIADYLEAETQRTSLSQQLASLINSREAYEKRTTILPKLEQNQRDLERNLEAAQSTYETLLTNLQKVQVRENENTANARIVEPAQIPQESAASLKVPILALGVMFGVLSATSSVLILEMSDSSLKTLKDVRKIFGYPMLGIIPAFSKQGFLPTWNSDSLVTAIPVRDTPLSQTSERYHMVQANLKLICASKQRKVVVVTSSVPQEGKSTVAANLAAAMAQLGHHVLLIDADLRHPSQHQVWELDNKLGLSDVSQGKADFWTAVSTEVTDNLDVLTAGVMPGNPLALFTSRRMAALIRDCSAKYDFVILDAPSLILTADALTLSQLTDGIVLVTQPGVVDSTSANAAQEMLERSDQKVLGLVVNGVTQKNDLVSKKI